MTCSSTRRCSAPTPTLGVPGLMRAWRAGNVALANAPGAGVADDKLVYTFVPDDDPLLPGRGRRSCRTCRRSLCASPSSCEHVLANLATLVVKPANESGGYGMLMGPTVHASASARSSPS